MKTMKITLIFLILLVGLSGQSQLAAKRFDMTIQSGIGLHVMEDSAALGLSTSYRLIDNLYIQAECFIYPASRARKIHRFQADDHGLVYGYVFRRRTIAMSPGLWLRYQFDFNKSKKKKLIPYLAAGAALLLEHEKSTTQHLSGQVQQYSGWDNRFTPCAGVGIRLPFSRGAGLELDYRIFFRLDPDEYNSVAEYSRLTLGVYFSL